MVAQRAVGSMGEGTTVASATWVEEESVEAELDWGEDWAVAARAAEDTEAAGWVAEERATAVTGAAGATASADGKEAVVAMVVLVARWAPKAAAGWRRTAAKARAAAASRSHRQGSCRRHRQVMSACGKQWMCIGSERGERE